MYLFHFRVVGCLYRCSRIMPTMLIHVRFCAVRDPLTCALLDADSRALHVGGLGVDCGVVEGIGRQALEAVVSRRALHRGHLGSAVGGWGVRGGG